MVFFLQTVSCPELSTKTLWPVVASKSNQYQRYSQSTQCMPWFSQTLVYPPTVSCKHVESSGEWHCQADQDSGLPLRVRGVERQRPLLRVCSGQAG